jgi:hypothetical protein
MADVPQQSPLTPALGRARALIASGDLDPAQVLLERAVELGRANLGEDDPDVLTAQRELAGVYLLIDDPMGARRVLEDAYAAGQWRLGDSDPVLLHISHDLGVVAQELGNRHEARKAFGRVAEHGPAVLGSGHQLVARARTYLNDDPSSATAAPAPRQSADPVVPPVPQPVPVDHPAPLTRPVPADRVPIARPVDGPAPTTQPVPVDGPLPITQRGPVDGPAPIAQRGPVDGPVPINQRGPLDGPVPITHESPSVTPRGYVTPPPAVVEPARVNPVQQAHVTPAPAVEERAHTTPPPTVERAPDHGDAHGHDRVTRAAMEQPTHVFPVARPRTDDGTADSPDVTTSKADGPVGNPWGSAPHPPPVQEQPQPPSVPQQRQGSTHPPEFPEQRREPPHRPDAREHQSTAPQQPHDDRTWQGSRDQTRQDNSRTTQQGYGQAEHSQAQQTYGQPQHGYGQAEHAQTQQGYAQTQRGYGQTQHGYGGQAGHEAHPGYPDARPQPQAATEPPAVWQNRQDPHPGWQGPLPVAVSAGHPYPGERVDERPVRGRGLAVGLTVVATLMAVIAVGALVVVLVQREQQPVTAPQAPVTVTASGPVLAGDPPTGVKLGDQGTVVTVTWSDPTDGKVPFIVMMAQEGQQLKPTVNAGLTKEAARVRGLNPALQYCFAVVAVYATDRYATSDQVCTQRN